MDKRIVASLLCLLLFPAAVIGLSGDPAWPQGWIFSVWFTFMGYSTLLYVRWKDPALFMERMRPGKAGREGWDRIFFVGAILGMIVWIMLMPLDAKRFGWSPSFPIWVNAIGFVLLVVSYVFIFRSMADNTFTSPLVRVQRERGHLVVSTGVYGLVRHPMYLGAILMMFGTPLLLGSLYGLLFSFVLMFMMVGRIFGEEAMLMRELDGYREYMLKVRYRLIPHVW